RRAALRESATMSGLYSMPRALAPRLAAVITVRPSPEPRSTNVSYGVSAAMSSMRSTSACGVGTQITSLPDCPTVGVKVPLSASVVEFWARAAPDRDMANNAVARKDLRIRIIIDCFSLLGWAQREQGRAEA